MILELTRVDAFRVDSRNSGQCYAIILRDIGSDKAVMSTRWLEPVALLLSVVSPSLAKEDSHGAWDL